LKAAIDELKRRRVTSASAEGTYNSLTNMPKSNELAKSGN
jgi:hypothetical protein